MGYSWFFALAGFVCACVSMFGQGTTSRVLGTVQDSSGAVVADATVKLINEGTRVTFETKTSVSGSYAFEAVQPGAYELTVEASGFRKFASHNNQVTIGQPATPYGRTENPSMRSTNFEQRLTG